MFEDVDAMEAYKEKAVEDFYDPVKDERYSVIGEDGMLFESVGTIMKAMTVIEKVPGDIFTLRSFEGAGEPYLTRNQQCVLSAVLINYFDIERGRVLFKINPYVNSFFECYMIVRPLNPYKVGALDLVECIRGLNRFVAAVRDHTSTKAFSREIAAHARAANKNYSGLLGYIDALFGRYSRLLVLRIDFAYGKGKFEIEELSDSRDRLDVLNLVSKQIISHRAELISYLKNKCPELGVVGYVWKLEYGREKGHHYHMMFFLDGSKVRQDIVIAKWIGEYWNNVITLGKGVYYNCNGDKSKYKFCGVGMINHDESDKVSNLKKAAVYLAKVDRYISACMPENKRTFGKGGAPKGNCRSVGRPRRN